jgi:hypothetical protein
MLARRNKLDRNKIKRTWDREISYKRQRNETCMIIPRAPTAEENELSKDWLTGVLALGTAGLRQTGMLLDEETGMKGYSQHK